MGEFISDTDQEFCTVYNMVRVALFLYDWTGDREYADYVERALYNGFLAQQSGVSGMPAYFLSMVPGSRKKWGTKRNDFWCCTGTMVQAQTLYPQMIYRVDADKKTFFISQYIPSEACFDVSGKEAHVRQITSMKNYSNQAFFDERGGGSLSRWSLEFKIDIPGDDSWEVALRVPSWCRGIPALTVNGETVSPEDVSSMISEGYIRIKRSFADVTIGLCFDTEPVLEYLPDDDTRAAFLSGPVVLAGLTDKEKKLTGESACEMLKRRITHTYSTFPWQQDHFITTGQDENTEFIPLYEVEDQAYTVYFQMK